MKTYPVISQPTNLPSFLSWRIASGTVPVSTFWDKIKFCRLLRDEKSGNEPDNSFKSKLIVINESIWLTSLGRGPCKLLCGIDKYSKPCSCPKLDGIVPVMLFIPKLIDFKFVALPSVAGMTPLNMLCSRSRNWRSAYCPTTGKIGPEKLL